MDGIAIIINSVHLTHFWAYLSNTEHMQIYNKQQKHRNITVITINHNRSMEMTYHFFLFSGGGRRLFICLL